MVADLVLDEIVSGIRVVGCDSTAPKSLPSEVCEWMHGEMQKES